MILPPKKTAEIPSQDARKKRNPPKLKIRKNTAEKEKHEGNKNRKENRYLPEAQYHPRRLNRKSDGRWLVPCPHQKVAKGGGELGSA